ncbi:MAG: hypothetical protein GKR94_16420 [Gammaproteobacteria bacterium]|nr:hypothetical protein [Gammaproteobacteria bacterium]
MAWRTRFIEKSPRLTVNTRTSAVARPWERTFLGFTFTPKPGDRLKVAGKSFARLKQRVREVSRRTRGPNIGRIIAALRQTLFGWKADFGLAEGLSPGRDLNKWTRRRLRTYQWKQWARRGYRALHKLGVERQRAWNRAKSAQGLWRISASAALRPALPNRYYRHSGLAGVGKTVSAPTHPNRRDTGCVGPVV